MKTKVVVLYGGQSTEHEISRRSAAFVLRNLDPQRYDVLALAITQDGRWLPQDPELLLAEIDRTKSKVLPIMENVAQNPLYLQMQAPLQIASREASPTSSDTVFFPVIHGTHGEDGSLQGFLDMANVAYVGPNTLGSAIAIDKVIAKQRLEAAGLPVVEYRFIRYDVWRANPELFAEECIKALGESMFVKPACLGSSVGVSPAKGKEACIKACELAFKYDNKVLVERRINAREIECAALGEWDPDISMPGEVTAHSGFYSFDAKYEDPNASSIQVPAHLTPEQTKEIRELSRQAFQALELYGMARIDWFLCRDTGKFYFNEANTIPGFTEISQYPMLWKHSGVNEQELISRLIELAQKRHQNLNRLKRQREE